VSYWVKRLEEVPLVPTDDADDFDWYPLQHHFGIGAFGVNAFGGAAGTTIVAEHDERKSGQEELYVVMRGAARFTLDGEEHDARAISVVAIPDPEVTRKAVATEDETIVLAVGAPADTGFATTWNPAHFGQLPQAD
jgi:quercetin dioxygenase-like cupin family protein